VRPFWKIALPIAACIALICGTSIAWHVHKAKAHERMLAETARVTLVRAQQGDAKSQFDLGHMYFHGEGVPQNDAEALLWFRKAADQGNAKAQYGIGYMYHNGKGVQQNDAEALRWNLLSAKQGYAKAQVNLGSMYYYGQGVTQDYTEALRWYRLAADQGDAPAQEDLGSMYYYGCGVPQDAAQAVDWYRKAANQGYARAQYDLASMYYYGRGITKDEAQAVNWYRKAAEQGDASAQYDLSYMYYYGQGVPRNFFKANRWVRKAADQGDAKALSVVSEQLTTCNELSLVIPLLIGLYLTFNFFPANILEPGTSLREPRQQLISATGLLWLFTVGMNWYGYTHDKIRRLFYGVNTFTLIHWLLEAAAWALLIYIVRSGTKPDASQDEPGSSEIETRNIAPAAPDPSEHV
jgi:TPR repeat protein